jgi:hypothetical protein
MMQKEHRHAATRSLSVLGHYVTFKRRKNPFKKKHYGKAAEFS